MIVKRNLKREDLRFVCPSCGADLSREPVLWGEGFDYDSAHCPDCGFDGYLKSMTGTETDNTLYQYFYEDKDFEE